MFVGLEYLVHNCSFRPTKLRASSLAQNCDQSDLRTVMCYLLTSESPSALSFVLQDAEKTLTDTEIDKVMEKLIKAFEKEAGAEIRKA